ncbi:MAG: hypothetical protein ACREJU_11500 [Nitrospiraceae bacterium]
MKPYAHPFGVLVILCLAVAGCVAAPPSPGAVLWESGRDQVRLDTDAGGNRNSHPAALTPSQVGTLLRGVRAGERRGWIHRLASGEAVKTRAFRDDEIEVLAVPLANALAKAGPAEQVSFHLSQSDPTGGEVTTTGWIFVREPLLYLQLSEVHDLHGPDPDISKYMRNMPDVPTAPVPFDVTFEPQDYLDKEVSKGSWWAPDQLEELHIRYREALAVLPPYSIDGSTRQEPPAPFQPRLDEPLYQRRRQGEEKNRGLRWPAAARDTAISDGGLGRRRMEPTRRRAAAHAATG